MGSFSIDWHRVLAFVTINPVAIAMSEAEEERLHNASLLNISLTNLFKQLQQLSRDKMFK